MTESATRLRAIETELVSCYLAARPLTAALLGEPGWRDQLLPLVAPDARQDLGGRISRARAQLAEIAPAELDEEQHLTREMLSELSGYDADDLAACSPRYTVSPLPEAGLTGALLLFLPQASISSVADLESFASACAAIPGALRDSQAELAAGRAAGQRPVGHLTQRAADQIEQYLATPVDHDTYVLAACSARIPEAGSLAGDIRRIIASEVRPAFRQYRDSLYADVVPDARDADHPGLVWLPGGEATYRAAVRAHTTLDVTPEAVHQSGQDLVAAIRTRAEATGRSLGWDLGFAAIRDRLREDRSLYFGSAAQMIAAASAALQRAEEVVPQWICEPPAASCAVREMDALETRNGVLGHYQSAPLDRHRPGWYWLNTGEPASHPVYEAEALAHHESVPGHHIEISKSQEAPIDSPFRRLAEVTPYREGWALYMEHLADDIGLYSGPLDRLGMLSFQLWRAGRLVVDTGMHLHGWSRRRAVTYLWENTILSRGNVENEIDRYIACPGQALGYMTGQLAFEQLRARLINDSSSPAQNRAFHSRLLEHGPLTLGCLSRSLGIDLAVLT